MKLKKIIRHAICVDVNIKKYFIVHDAKVEIFHNLYYVSLSIKFRQSAHNQNINLYTYMLL